MFKVRLNKINLVGFSIISAFYSGDCSYTRYYFHIINNLNFETHSTIFIPEQFTVKAHPALSHPVYILVTYTWSRGTGQSNQSVIEDLCTSL